jgi:hypothetical protein
VAAISVSVGAAVYAICELTTTCDVGDEATKGFGIDCLAERQKHGNILGNTWIYRFYTGKLASLIYFEQISFFEICFEIVEAFVVNLVYCILFTKVVDNDVFVWF